MNDPASNVEAWMGKAEEDRLCIRNNLAAAAVPWAAVCFHAQQAVEKYLKAFLIAHAVRVERTHDLAYLLGVPAVRSFARSVAGRLPGALGFCRGQPLSGCAAR